MGDVALARPRPTSRDSIRLWQNAAGDVMVTRIVDGQTQEFQLVTKLEREKNTFDGIVEIMNIRLGRAWEAL